MIVAPLLAACLLAPACSRERSRAVDADESDAAAEGPRDYREMLSRARAKNSDVQILNDLENAIQRFQYELARLPTNLSELVGRRYIENIPPPPRGRAYTYDPVHGNVGIADLPDDSGIQLPSEATNAAPVRLQDVPLPEQP